MKRNEANKIIRKYLGLSCTEMARRVETTKQTISNYERGISYTRVLERVYEWELDAAIERYHGVDVNFVKQTCKELQKERES